MRLRLNLTQYRRGRINRPGLPEWGVDIPDNIRRQMGQADYCAAPGIGSVATWLHSEVVILFKDIASRNLENRIVRWLATFAARPRANPVMGDSTQATEATPFQANS